MVKGKAGARGTKREERRIREGKRSREDPDGVFLLNSEARLSPKKNLGKKTR
jgi:hypothetical protein